VNNAWDIPKTATMNAFAASYPQWKDNLAMQSMFEWKWYYAFQQVGDQIAAPLSHDYRAAARKKYTLAGYVSLFSPPLLLQRILTRLADTDAIAAFEYEQSIRDFHQSLREFYYPFLFISPELTPTDFDKAQLIKLPSFSQVTINKRGVAQH
jgi:ABC-2 type transport system permease protein